MRIQFLHLSDLHLGHHSGDHRERAVAIVDSCRARITTADDVIVAVTGDVAFSGKAAQYETATEFFHSLMDGLKAACPGAIHLVLVPGNHDCEFTADKVRESVLKGIDPDNVEENEVAVCTAVQEHFFQFNDAVSTLESPSSGWRASPLVEQVLVLSTGHRVGFRLFNSAWMSQLQERQGALLMPRAGDSSVGTADLVVSMFHHPYKWFEAVNARWFRKEISHSSDVVLTGHEHDSAVYSFATASSNTEYVEGGVLFEHGDEGVSSFNLLEVDVQTSRYSISQYRMEGTQFVEVESLDRAFERNRALRAQTFAIRKEFLSTLMDPGTVLNHPRVPSLSQDDLYVYPDVRQVELLKSSVMDRSSPLSLLDKHGRVLFFGPERCGKSALAKQLFYHLHGLGLLPILLNGATFRPSNRRAVLKLLKRAAGQQYHEGAVDRVVNAKKEIRAILVDDVDKIRLKKGAQADAIGQLMRLADVVVLIGGEEFRWQEIDRYSECDETKPILTDFVHAEILPLGHVRRSELVKKWHLLGVAEPDLAAVEHKIVESERQISSLMRTSLLPPYPVFVLMMLSQLDAGRRLNAQAGSHGYLYQALITQSLYGVSKNSHEIDQLFSYLTQFAVLVSGRSEGAVGVGEAAEWHRSYCEQFFVDLDFTDILSRLCRALVLVARDGGIRFAYPYLYYYFYARHLSDTIDEEPTRQTVRELTRTLHLESSADIFLFLSYLSKNTFVIRTILETASGLFEGGEEVDFKEQTRFLNGLTRQTPELVLDLQLDTDRNRKRELEARDERDDRLETDDRDYEFDETVGQFQVMNAAHRTIQIVGQILRNYSGSLPGDRKIALCRACASLSYRVIGFVLELVNQHGEALIGDMVHIIADLHPEAGRERITREANGFLFDLCRRAAFGAMKHLSAAVGQEELDRVFREVFDGNSEFRDQVALMTIRMDHYKAFPKTEVLSVYRETGENPYTAGLVRHLVWYHLYVRRTPFRVRAEVCAKLGIKQNTLFIENRAKSVSMKHSGE